MINSKVSINGFSFIYTSTPGRIILRSPDNKSVIAVAELNSNNSYWRVSGFGDVVLPITFFKSTREIILFIVDRVGLRDKI